jgi:hypothetical protein
VISSLLLISVKDSLFICQVAKRKVKILRIGGIFIVGIVSLVLLTTVVFYLGRGYFMKRAVIYLNEQQPGEVQMGQMNLIPFLNFPDITLNLQDVQFFEREPGEDSAALDPILSLEEIGVTLDLVKLIKGSIMVSEARLKDGFVHMEIYSDSISNLEHALGIRFGEAVEKDTSSITAPLAIDLDKIELINVRARMDNRVNDEYLDIEVNQLESSFSSLSGQIRAAIEVDIYINMIKYQTIDDQVDKHIALKGSIILDPDSHLLELEPSSLNVSGLAFETWGKLDLRSTPRIDLAFTATNEGLELLNYLFMGILDLDEIEQIGGGSISLNGTVQGNMGGEQLPVVRLNGEAKDLGFRIKPVNRDVTGISFRLLATNGSESDLSEAYLDVRDFKAKFPEGNIYTNLRARNIKSPELNIEVDCAVNLEGLEEMFKKDFLSNLAGSVTIQGALSGNVNRESGDFLNEEGSLKAILDDVSFVINHDSVNRDSLANISGEIVLHDTIIEAERLSMAINGNQFDLGISSENLLLYLLDYNRNVAAGISVSSEQFNPATLLRDSSISDSFGEEIQDFYFSAGAMIEKNELDDFLDHDSIPEMEITMDSFGISMPKLADISRVGASISFGPDSISLHQLAGTIGESSFDFSGILANYGALTQGDSGEFITLDFNISSDLMHARDLLTIDNEFLLPQTYITEYLEDFRMTGRLEAPAAGLAYDSISMDFVADIQDMGWKFRYYPDEFKNFLIQIKREGDLLRIDQFQGSIGENNLSLSASIGNFTDSLVENMYGSLEMYSDLLDFNQLLNYQQPENAEEAGNKDSSEIREPPKLYEVDYPQIDFTVNIGELRYAKHTIYGMNGKLRTSRDKIFYLDQLSISPEGRGTLAVNGQLNISNPEQYVLSADLKLNGIDIGDLNLELQSGDTLYTLKDNFNGVVDARGLAEIFITPELNVDMPTSTAQFNVTVNDGALINFTPLQAAGKFLDSKDLNNVRFATVRNSFTLMDSKITMPLMNVESTVGQLLIQGEQGLDGSYLYLVHVPTKLAKEAARSAMSEGAKDDGEDQISQMKRGRFLKVTVWSDGIESEVKLKDRREDYK